MKEISEIVKQQRLYFHTGITKEYGFRMKKLKRLYSVINKYQDEILVALKKDLNKPEFEAYETEVGIILDELRKTMKQLQSYMKPKTVKTTLSNFPGASKIYAEPYGVALIIAPWNYPFQLVMSPLIGAVAAGNCVVVKPSEDSVYTSAIVEKIIHMCFHEANVTTVQGGVEVSNKLLAQRFDYIFFTGSTAVGKIVMQAAAKNLTPVSLELGGKSPCIVDETANIEVAARRIVWGKFLNAGQTCVAPDYVMVQSKVKDALIQEIKKCIEDFYGEDASQSEDYTKIVNQKHFYRLLGLMDSGHIVHGGQSSETMNQIAPTLLDQVTWDSAVMQEEIFGPILPILEFKNLKEVVLSVGKRPKPLALYYFTTNKKNEHYILSNLSFGGGCINDTVMHLAAPELPFGGVGDSGIGCYHGKASFDTFSHYKSVLKKSNAMDVMLRYPPYKDKIKLLKKILR